MSDKDQRQRRDSRVRQPFPKSRGRAKAKALRFDTLSLSPQDFIHIPCSFLPSFLTNLQMPKGDSEEGSLTVCHGVWLCRLAPDPVSSQFPPPSYFSKRLVYPVQKKPFTAPVALASLSLCRRGLMEKSTIAVQHKVCRKVGGRLLCGKPGKPFYVLRNLS